MAKRTDLIAALEAQPDYEYLMKKRREIPALQGSKSTEKLVIHYIGDYETTNTPLDVEVMWVLYNLYISLLFAYTSEKLDEK